MWEEYRMEDAEYCLVAFGIAARVTKAAIDEARKKGIRGGHDSAHYPVALPGKGPGGRGGRSAYPLPRWN